MVDALSQDSTAAIAAVLGAQVWPRRWEGHARQLGWALERLAPEGGWVLRLDADEILTAPLAAELAARLPLLGADIAGATVLRRMRFQGRTIRHGGVFPLEVLRLVRPDRARCEPRLVDEHMRVDGAVARFEGEILDDSLLSLSEWTEKHNGYASREAVELLHLAQPFLARGPLPLPQGRAGRRRALKERVYARLPAGTRAAAYFLYRFVLRGGFRDGREGRAFHLLQGFWYRYLVDAKLAELRRHMAREGRGPEAAVREVLGIELP